MMVSPKSSTEDRLPGPNAQNHHRKAVASFISPLRRIYALAGLVALVLLYFIYQRSPFAASVPGIVTENVHLSALSLEDWLEAEEIISYEQIYQNIGTGARARDAALGAVIASPSTNEPDYYYQWVRDAAITYKTIVGQYITGNESLGSLIDHWAKSQDAIQHTLNPSGAYHSGGIGEPKFNVDNSVFDHSWGRPQDDGPAIRATVLMAYANSYLAAGGDSKSIALLYRKALPADSVIKADLEYVSHNWQQESTDLWEEVQGLHFFTLMVQLRSMAEGSRFATRMSDPEAAAWYKEQAIAMTTKLDDFWSAKDGWIISTIGRDPEKPRGGLDCGTILGSLHGSSDEQPAYSPGSDRMLATHYAYVQSMKSTYKINNASDIPGVAVGRYPEDVYDGYHKSLGNPWYLCTSAAAELMYAADDSIRKKKNITITKTSEQFYQQFLPTASADTVFSAGDKEYETILRGMRAHGDEFLATVRHFAQTNGSLSEQYNRDTGKPQGARDLTWSYGAFISAVQQRRGELVF